MSEQEINFNRSITHYLDLRGTIMPFSLLKISQALRGIEPGESLEVLWSDPDTPADLFKILPHNAYAMVGMDRVEEKDPYFRLMLLKRSVADGPKEDDGICEGRCNQNLITTAAEERWTSSKHKEDIMTELNLSEIKASSTVDARGSACPGPLLEAKKGIGKVKVGEVLEIYSADSGTRKDIPAWAKKVGHDYLGILEVDGYDKHFVRRNK
ncbi:MAG: sulfurtransferase TusA family protein [Desulfobacterales bacterium]|jgi:TusA-related sulfurtransferase